MMIMIRPHHAVAAQGFVCLLLLRLVSTEGHAIMRTLNIFDSKKMGSMGMGSMMDSRVSAPPVASPHASGPVAVTAIPTIGVTPTAPIHSPTKPSDHPTIDMPKYGGKKGAQRPVYSGSIFGKGRAKGKGNGQPPIFSSPTTGKGAPSPSNPSPVYDEGKGKGATPPTAKGKGVTPPTAKGIFGKGVTKSTKTPYAGGKGKGLVTNPPQVSAPTSPPDTPTFASPTVVSPTIDVPPIESPTIGAPSTPVVEAPVAPITPTEFILDDDDDDDDDDDNRDSSFGATLGVSDDDGKDRKGALIFLYVVLGMGLCAICSISYCCYAGWFKDRDDDEAHRDLVKGPTDGSITTADTFLQDSVAYDAAGRSVAPSVGTREPVPASRSWRSMLPFWSSHQRKANDPTKPKSEPPVDEINSSNLAPHREDVYKEQPTFRSFDDSSVYDRRRPSVSVLNRSNNGRIEEEKREETDDETTNTPTTPVSLRPSSVSDISSLAFPSPNSTKSLKTKNNQMSGSENTTRKRHGIDHEDGGENTMDS